MFPLLIPMLLGAGIGAATSKDKLKGALMGAGLGATGGALAPGLLGAAGAAGATGAAGAAGTAAANPLAAYMATGAVEGSTMGSALTGAGGSAGAVGQGSMAGLLDTAKTAMGYAKPIGDAAGAANAVGGLLSGRGDQAPAPTPMPQTSGGSQTLTALAQQGDQQTLAQMQADEQKRQMRRKMIQQMGVM
jgi:pilus assembly protein FimV